GDQVIHADAPVRRALAGRQLAELDVVPRKVAAFARDEHDVAPLGLDHRLAAGIREVGDGEQVHHTPDLIGRVAAERTADRAPHRAARSIAADDIAGPDPPRLAG